MKKLIILLLIFSTACTTTRFGRYNNYKHPYKKKFHIEIYHFDPYSTIK